MVKILLDTNILIALEDPIPTSHPVATFSKLCEAHNLQRFICRANFLDVFQDKDRNRLETMRSKLWKFPELDSLPYTDTRLEEIFGPNNTDNDYRDMKLLAYLLDNVVDFLVSEDDALKRRAERAGFDNQVLDIQEMLHWIRLTYEPKSVHLPYIVEKKAYQLDLSDPLFNSIRLDYVGFDKWFTQKCKNQHRDCWVVRIGERMAGIAIRKDETPEEADCVSQANQILKICTLKISDEFSGEKLGEQILKQILWWAWKNHKQLVYLTIFGKQQKLIDLLMRYGFLNTRTLATQELVFEKELIQGNLPARSTESDILEYSRRIYPRFYDGEDAQKFLVPIRPEYHSILFPELHLEPLQIDLFPSNHTPGNTIRKVYLCRSNTKQLKYGDLIFFYMSKFKDPRFQDSQIITSIGIVEQVSYAEDLAGLIRLTAKRSVYSKEGLMEYFEAKNTPMMVIDFLLVPHLEPPIALLTLKREQVITSPPQCIIRLKPTKYLRLRSLMQDKIISNLPSS